ncbi:UDP-N-acetylmuramoylalanine--D-glutamate ligase [Dysgonomonas alginatilytica]|uniref:UDP-N-acetylmuramoylalanine--D-glutamate ligase n=1 Tax=Dysgonomonas alginatilytica TaxID=1605892 RepID=A0A2V3PT00_9BACT|nr:UDP-N-acetylmuramoyl-L-alanine--D-glutamate ligase [Dysgonomonas alginatilytica]PXV68159.1 UDP-N-acetylmuramoylalanine--D-glutamate ligase [Dysgonomonas alginatilytica]
MKKIVILGGGESGVGSAILAQAKGFEVFLSDNGALQEKYKIELTSRNIPFEEKGHTEENILSAGEIIKSPGIPDSVPLIQQAKAKGISIISEIEFAGRYTDATKICITGSNGKTTTTSLLYHLLKSAGLNVGLGGNIGKSFARQVAENSYDYYVLELSSFQLDNMYDFKADIAILLNITPDHLDRYDHDFQKYVDAKMRITQNQTPEDAFIYWAEDPVVTKEVAKKQPIARVFTFSEHKADNVSAYADNDQIVINTSKSVFTMEQDLLALTGTHNLYNSLASAIAAKLLDIKDEKIRQSLSDFKGVEHRLEKVATVRGIQFINDSKATNVNSCWYALKSMKTKVVLILGGTDKGNDYQEIEELVKTKVHALVFLGVDNSKLHKFFDGKIGTIVDAGSMEEAVTKAYSLSKEGDSVLLSPCCASFDLFKNYEDRGDQFKYWVRKL